MKLQEIRELLHKAPFDPFSLELSNGRRVEIGHPEIVAIPVHGRFLVVPGKQMELLEPEHITAAIFNVVRKRS